VRSIPAATPRVTQSANAALPRPVFQHFTFCKETQNATATPLVWSKQIVAAKTALSVRPELRPRRAARKMTTPDNARKRLKYSRCEIQSTIGHIYMDERRVQGEDGLHFTRV
jgi:hypothetical protein